jgi:hypothetical protein
VKLFTNPNQSPKVKKKKAITGNVKEIELNRQTQIIF